MSRKVRTRYAPSPTGFQHIGGIRTALFCYLFTKKMNGDFILRIEDTDRTRFVQGAEEYIVQSLAWCGITCAEGIHVGGEYGPYRQSERKDIYKKYVDQLLASGHAYYAFDTPEELAEMRENLKKQGSKTPQYNAITRQYMKNSLVLSEDEVQKRLEAGEPHVVRLKVPRKEDVKIHDLVRGWVIVNSSQIDDKVLMKGDGMPTYHLANVVDDHLMEISHVVRGEEWLPSTPLHVLLYKAFGWEDTMPQFAHLPLILKPTGKGKLSKRDGDKLGFPVFPLAWQHPLKDESSSGFREIGFFPEAFVNMLAFLGWNPGTSQEVFSMEELIQAFSIERISKSGAKFDFTKAKWFNQQYLKAKPDAEIATAVLAQAPEAYKNVDTAFLTKACGLLKERMTFISDFWTEGSYFFSVPTTYEAKVVRKKWKMERVPLFEQLKDALLALTNFTTENVEATVKAFVQESGLGFGNVLQPFRVMLAGTVAGPPIFEVAALLGQKEVISRMTIAMKAFEEMKASV